MKQYALYVIGNIVLDARLHGNWGLFVKWNVFLEVINAQNNEHVVTS
jgi:hypothetical protein